MLLKEIKITLIVIFVLSSVLYNILIITNKSRPNIPETKCLESCFPNQVLHCDSKKAICSINTVEARVINFK